ncbi:alpha/beta hydrolase, partial [Vibrio parahaemolyticus]
APPAGMFDFSFLAPCPSSGLIIQGTADTVVAEAEVQKLSDRLQKQRDIKIDYRKVEGAGHFFDDRLDELTGLIDRHLKVALAAPPPEA